MGYWVDSLSNLLWHKIQAFLTDVFTAKGPQQHDRWTEPPAACQAKISGVGYLMVIRSLLQVLELQIKF